MLRRADVMVSPHGADMINGLALHAGASVIEVLPPLKDAGCPCGTFRDLYALERSKIFYFAMATSNRSLALDHGFGFHSDILVPPPALKAALDRVLSVKGDPKLYRVREFAY